MAERHVKAWIDTFFARSGMVRKVRRAEAVVAWPRIVGHELARFTSARALKNGVLFVDVADSETAMHLSLARPRILAAYAALDGPNEVRDVRFVAGRRAPDVAASDEAAAPGRHVPHDAPVDEAAWRALGGTLSELHLDEPLEAGAVAAARSMLHHRARAREAGWRACRLCGALHPNEDVCDPCARYRTSPSVDRAADALMVAPGMPTPTLSDDERAVAIDLACERLDAMIRAMLAEVLVTPSVAPQLELATRNRVALATGIAVEGVKDEDVMRYDARVARALGRWGSSTGRDEGHDERT